MGGLGWPTHLHFKGGRTKARGVSFLSSIPLLHTAGSACAIGELGHAPQRTKPRDPPTLLQSNEDRGAVMATRFWELYVATQACCCRPFDLLAGL